MAPAFGNVKYSEFDPGDSILKSTNLLAAYHECGTLYGRAVAAYNAANPAVPIAAPDSSIDPETSQKTFNFTLLTRKEYVAASRSFVTKPLDYIKDNAGWTVPTSGNLENVESLGEAMFLLHQAVKAGNDLVTPNLLFNDPSGNTTIADNSDGAIECTSIIVVNESVDATTGLPTYTPWNYFLLLDEQQGV